MIDNTEISRRRTFAIISHPDAGKTTLTEKFLLHSGAVDLAGSVRARKNQRATASDWMELEKQRGISISSTVLQFDYGNYRVNLLDTPGHKDFSEDTYRVLTAVDSVIMIIDAGVGIELQTRKLFEVCRQRRIPIFTFMNKVDRPTREPLALLDELEEIFELDTFTVNWPLGTGPDFRGVYDRVAGKAYLFEKQSSTMRALASVHDLSDPAIRESLPDRAFPQVTEELELLEVAGNELDLDAVSKGELTPVFFGSAVFDFGVELLLHYFLKYAPAPVARLLNGSPLPPDDPRFSGFIFKIQANLDPRHRDRVAFLRVCSGRFVRDMTATHVRTDRKLRLSNSRKIFGRERETLDEAYAGDILGLVGHPYFQIGDTISAEGDIDFAEIPRFQPECFAFLRPHTGSSVKAFRKGLDQLLQEGVVQAFYLPDSYQQVPLLAAVGPLQFEVLQARLESEYGVQSTLDMASWSVVHWIPGENGNSEIEDVLPGGCRLAEDADGNTVVLFSDDWTRRYFTERHPDIRLSGPPESKSVVQTA